VADGLVYHAINRGHNRDRVFGDNGDFRAFLRALGQTQQRYPFDLFGYTTCVLFSFSLASTRKQKFLDNSMQFGAKWWTLPAGGWPAGQRVVGSAGGGVFLSIVKVGFALVSPRQGMSFVDNVP
jgi:hypothetical protein